MSHPPPLTRAVPQCTGGEVLFGKITCGGNQRLVGEVSGGWE